MKRNQSGELNPCAKLTREQVQQIRVLALRGASQREIAEEYEVSQCLVSRIINRKTWIEGSEEDGSTENSNRLF